MKINERIIHLKDKSEVILRSPQKDDAQYLLYQLRKATKESYRNLNNSPESWLKVTTKDEEKIIEDMLASHYKFMISAFIGKDVIGNIGIVGLGENFLKNSAKLGMTVLEKYQGKGVGNALLKYGLEAAKSHHFHSVELLVRPYNYPAIALYEKFGFQQIGTLRDHVFIDGKFEDDLIYQKIL